MKWKYDEINEETLTALRINPECKKWVIRNIGTLPVRNLKFVFGNYNGYISELKRDYAELREDIEKDEHGNIISFTINGVRNKLTYDEHGNMLTCINDDGNRYENTYDERGNIIKHSDSSGFFYTQVYDDNGNLILYTDSTGYSYTKTYNKRGNTLTCDTSDGYSWNKTYNIIGNVMTYKDSNGVYKEYDYIHTREYFVMKENGKVILRVPLKIKRKSK